MRFILAVTIALSVVTVVPVFARETTGNLQGSLIDEEGNPVAFVNVIVTSPDLQGVRGRMSLPDGTFRILDLPIGTYETRIQHVNYRETVMEDVRVHLGTTTELGRIMLKARVHEVPEVRVTAERPLIDPVATHIGANLARTDFDGLPLDRNYRSISVLLPHANESFYEDRLNFAGATGLENRYFVDGIDVTDPYRGFGGSDLPYNFVREVQVRTGGYEAEYRSSLGGIMNVVTPSGGNEFTGQVFGFFINDRLTGDRLSAAFEPEPGPYSQYDIGFSVGGPIARDKLWFHAAYNPTVVREDVYAPGQGYFEDDRITHIFAGKLTWQASERNNIVFTLLSDTQSRDAVGEWAFGAISEIESLVVIDPYLTQIERGGTAASVSGLHLMSDRFLLRSGISVLRCKEKNVPATAGKEDLLYFREVLTGIVSGTPLVYRDNVSLQTTLEVDGTLETGRHMVKGGLAYRENVLDFDQAARVLAKFTDDLYFEIDQVIEAKFRNRIPSAFLQDSWRLTDGFTLNAGLRWDGQFIVASDGEVAQKILDQWQPRLGFVYQPDRAGNHKIMGSFGRFYQEMFLDAASGYYVDEGDGFWIYRWYDCDFRTDPECVPYDSLGVTSAIQPEIDDFKGQHYDEFTLGYERMVGQKSKAGIRGVYRQLRRAIEDGFVTETHEFWFGNPGYGPLSGIPEAKRDYTALELLFRREAVGGSLLASYVYSRNHGNYPGLFDKFFGSEGGMGVWPNMGLSFDSPGAMEKATGLLPDDRTHVLKLAASRAFGYGISTGAYFTWLSGTPRSVFVPDQSELVGYVFETERGSEGRTPSIWDLNLRLAYSLPQRVSGRSILRFTLDLLHVASQRAPIAYDEIRVIAYDGEDNEIENPRFGDVTAYLPPMAVRLGFEVDF
jgi:hypothetical protein